MSTPVDTTSSLAFDEKKEPDSGDIDVTPPTTKGPPMSPSKRRAKAASSAGLSELSKQLRILQAKNESQAVDINRLERQLRILAELQGISVADLRKALEDACANEAFGELQHRVAKLRAELEAASIAKRAEFAKDAAAPHIANLELRVGELEEVEEKHQTEIHHLYEQLRHERERATRLEAERDQHKKDAQEYLDKLNKERARFARLEASFQEQMQKHMEEQAKKMQQLAVQAAKAKQDADAASAAASALNSTSGSSDGAHGGGSASANRDRAANGSDAATSVNSISPEMAADYQRMVQALKDKDAEIRDLKAQLQAERDKWAQQLRAEREQIQKAQMDSKVGQDKMALTIQQLEDNDSQNELRLAQYKARFAVQDERIEDMGQQLNSLYTAFQLLKEEMEAEDLKQAALKCNLDEADAEIARQVHNMEKQKSQRGGFGSNTPRESAGSRRDGFADGFGATSATRHQDGAAGSSSQRGGFESPSQRGGSQLGGSQRGGFDTLSAVERDLVDQFETPSGVAKSSNEVPRVITTPSTVDTYSTTGGYPSAQAVGTPVNAYSASAQTSASRNAPSTPTTWQLLFPENNNRNSRNTTRSDNHSGVLISGLLIVKSKNSVVRKWKTKMSKLYLRGDHYQLDMGDTKSYALEFGISKVEFYPNHPLSFVVHVNPYEASAPIIYAAGTTEEDYNAWMQALTKATNGGEYEVSTPGESSRRSLVAPSSPSRAEQQHHSGSFRVSASSNESVRSGSQHTPQEQEDADLQRVLELSRQIV
eukprot:CAMPEP_0117023920 /NCGR_PEP_ID=MMETSP0472-20121206/17812_1 /TAXON_ID=693140 ORGANISM="Tiarina fusus, Strain LIS" /NCGR_SAMPLE_ID=MMETSP0472 /ASSEMBLY_ACC=CAM_ASM_000603 /LENGTH=769 /DNA_ID=CAMNT_0004730195 /DNA_START=225 /DNA_END=2534 /DNA_ORIENTATION=+